MSTTASADSIRSVLPKQLYELHKAGKSVHLIDVRTPAEYREVHIPFARNIPLDQLDVERLRRELGNCDGPIYLTCRSGNRAAKACAKLQAAGLDNVIVVEGGTEAWANAGLPVNRGKKTISLERQVRIAAGFLVALGSALAIFVHPYWAVLSGFVGLGLMYAGITDTCGMAMVLAKMPWNRVKLESGSATQVAKEQGCDSPRGSLRQLRANGRTSDCRSESVRLQGSVQRL